MCRMMAHLVWNDGGLEKSPIFTLKTFLDLGNKIISPRRLLAAVARAFTDLLRCHGLVWRRHI